MDGGLAASTSYTYTVSAFDAAGNNSAQSAGASATTKASTGGGIPPTLGWFQIPNTMLSSACPPASQYSAIQGNEGCSAVVNDWSGGTADPTRNRLIVWGGGHHGYYGNEVYGLDLNNLQLTRLNNPSDVSGINFQSFCGDKYADGLPSSRHTYGGLAYIPGKDEMFAYGGGMAGCGFLSQSTWGFKFGNMQWTNLSPSGGQPNGAPGEMAQYDPNTGVVYLADAGYTQTSKLWKYDPNANTYTLLRDESASWDIHQSGVLDTKRELFFVIGSGVFKKIDLNAGSSYVPQDLAASASGCSGLVSANYPGLAFDTTQNVVVGWAGGDSVYSYNPDKNSCVTQTFSGGPGATADQGTSGRFQYFPSLGVFGLVNRWDENAYTLRITPPGIASPVRGER
jgi:hypothetical protein